MTEITKLGSAGRSACRSVGRLLFHWLAMALILVACGNPLLSQTKLTVAAAADLQPVMQEMVGNYEGVKDNGESVSGKDVAMVYGSSGNLTTQIENGAPYDLFFAADSGYPRRLIREGKAIADSFHVYAVGNLVIWVPPRSRLDVERLGGKVLLDGSVHKIAIANPQHAPYGRAAVEALKNLGVYDQVSSRLVLGENVAQAAEFAQSGNAQAAIVALSLVLDSKMKYGRYWLVPHTAYTPLEQAAVVLSNSKHVEAARAFLDYVVGSNPRTLKSHGFDSPPGEARR